MKELYTIELISPISHINVLSRNIENNTFARNERKSSDKELLLAVLDLNLAMLAAHVCAIWLSTSALTPIPVHTCHYFVFQLSDQY